LRIRSWAGYIIVTRESEFSEATGLAITSHAPGPYCREKNDFENFLEKTSRLYEEECRAAIPATALEMYVKRWARWATWEVDCAFQAASAQR
jgi:hypothetical protein